MPAGPYEQLFLNGQDVPWYMLPFDREGQCTGPETRQALLQAVAGGGFTDVYLFSHGWNNDWRTARDRYDDFVYRYAGLRAQRGLKYPRPYRPLLAGMFWPSTAFVLPWERAPRIAGAGAVDDLELERAAAELSAALPEPERTRVAQLLRDQRGASVADQRELAGLLAPLWNRFQSERASADVALDPISADELLALWNAPAEPLDAGADARGEEDEFGGLAGGPASGGAAPEAAFSAGDLFGAPRNLLRLFTVLQMKDRAARVGGSGVGRLLHDILAGCDARVHLVGHSYGCVLLLSALSALDGAALPRKVDSALLLQAAVSRFCFAERVPGKDYPGGYRVAFERVVQPLLATFSKHDLPLTRAFHLAVRRDSDLGQPRIAGEPAAPSKYAALGGFGPEGCAAGERDLRDIHEVGVDYDLAPSRLRVIGLRADAAISGHGDVSVPQTWWALYNQVRMS